MEYQNIINKRINKKVIRPINLGLKNYVGVIKADRNTKYQESVDLLSQSYRTIENAEKLLKFGSIVDSCSLLRSALEYLMLGVNIQFNEKTYKEFINLSIGDKERDDTKPSRLITEYRKHLNLFSEDLFRDINREEKAKMLSELYNKLCYFTHGSLMVTSLSKIEKSGIREIYYILCKLNIYIVKLLLFYSLKYITHDEKYNISNDNLYLAYIFTIIKVSDLIKNNRDDITSLNKFLYLDKNDEYVKNSLEEAENISEAFKEQGKVLNDNKEILNQMLKEFFS